MISVLGTTGEYVLQPSLMEKHRKTLEWLSSTILWEREVIFFQKILDMHASKFTSAEDKQKISHFQNLITYYRGEVIHQLASKLREHEHHLAEVLRTKNELKTEYFKEHDSFMSELESFAKSFAEFKSHLFDFVEKAM
ncbi:MAG TPA: hypothetical protein VGK59_23100 [Ohtaekwangia sp.]